MEPIYLAFLSSPPLSSNGSFAPPSPQLFVLSAFLRPTPTGCVNLLRDDRIRRGILLSLLFPSKGAEKGTLSNRKFRSNPYLSFLKPPGLIDSFHFLTCSSKSIFDHLEKQKEICNVNDVPCCPSLTSQNKVIDTLNIPVSNVTTLLSNPSYLDEIPSSFTHFVRCAQLVVKLVKYLENR